MKFKLGASLSRPIFNADTVNVTTAINNRESEFDCIVEYHGDDIKDVFTLDSTGVVWN